jgi:hypothetical protein
MRTHNPIQQLVDLVQVVGVEPPRAVRECIPGDTDGTERRAALFGYELLYETRAFNPVGDVIDWCRQVERGAESRFEVPERLLAKEGLDELELLVVTGCFDAVEDGLA